jgi:hypothetical protein
VRAFAPHEHPRTGRPAVELELVGDLADMPVWALAVVLVDRRDPGTVGDLEDRGSDGLGQVITDGVADPRLATPLQQLVAGPGGVDAQQQLDALDVLAWNLLEGLLGDGDLVGGGVRAGVAARSSPASASLVSFA